MPVRDILLALLCTTLWGCSFVAIKLGLREAPPLALTALRFLFAAVPAVLLVPRPQVRASLLLIYGLALGFCQFGLLFLAITWGMPAGLSSLVIQTQVFFTLGLAVLVLGERPHPAQIAGAAIAGAGILALARSMDQSAGFAPLALVLAAALAWGLANITAKRAGRVPLLPWMAWSSLVSVPPLILLSVLTEDRGQLLAIVSSVKPVLWLSVLYLSVVATLLAFGLWSQLLARHPAGAIAPFPLLVPIWGMGSTGLILDEALPPGLALGGSLVFAGLAVTVLAPRLLQRSATT